MSCNGFNHRPGCACAFKGGHGRLGSRRNLRQERKRFVTRVEDARRICPRCQKTVYFFRFASGGSGAFDTFGPPWIPHACMHPATEYSPFGLHGRPKLRNRRSEYERDGWVPIYILRVEEFPSSIIVHGIVLDRPDTLHIGVRRLWNIDRAQPAYVRHGGTGRVTLNAFIVDADRFIDLDGVLDCSAPMDIEFHCTPT